MAKFSMGLITVWLLLQTAVFRLTRTTAMITTTSDSPVATSLNVERAQMLLQYLTDEAYRFFLTPFGAMIRPAGAYPKTCPSDYAHHDADELQDILMRSDHVRALVFEAPNTAYSLHLVNVTDEGGVVFAKEILGGLNGDAERVSASL